MPHRLGLLHVGEADDGQLAQDRLYALLEGRSRVLGRFPCVGPSHSSKSL